MKRTLLSLSLSFVTTLAAHGQNPAASLGLPRASLGVPPRASAGPALVVPANHNEVSAPVIVPPDLPGPDMTAPAPTPYRFIEAPKPMPKANIIEDGKGISSSPPNAPAVSGPFLSPSVDCEGSLCQDPNGTPAFLRNDRWRFTSEYLMWWTNGSPTPTLVSTGPAASNGILGQPGVASLFGGDGNAATIMRSGYRGGFEWWFGPRGLWAFDGHGFFLSQRGSSTAFSSDQNPLIARPFNNLNTGLPSAEIVAFPGVFRGGIAVGQSSSLLGADLNLRRKLYDGCKGCYVDLLFGYRMLSMSEELSIAEQSTRLNPIANPNPANPSQSIVHGTAFDRFQTKNVFNGGQIGTAMGFTHGRWTLDMRTLVAIGATSSIVDISGGQSNTLNNGTTVSTPGGLLALNSNSGRFYHQQFSIVPEVTFNLGYNLSEHCRLFVGYNFLYWTHVLRPGDQVDTGLDANRIPNFPASVNTLSSARPTVPMTQRDFFAQGINFGLMLKW